jgi:hypothetical protein
MVGEQGRTTLSNRQRRTIFTGLDAKTYFGGYAVIRRTATFAAQLNAFAGYNKEDFSDEKDFFSLSKRKNPQMGVLQNLTDLYLCRRYSIKKEMMK